MELRHIRAFLAVAEERHFSRAAERLHMSQPPLSAAVRELERELGVRLFDRTTRSVQLTSVGEALLEPARAALRSIESMAEVAGASAAGTIGTVRAGFGGTTGYAVLADLVGAARDQEPGVRIELVSQTYSGEAVEKVRSGDLDIAVTAALPPEPVTSFVLTEVTLVVAVPADHRLAQHAALAPEQLTGTPLVMYPSTQGSWVRHATLSLLSSAGVSITVAAEAPDPFSLLTLVGTGVGAAVIVDPADRIQVAGVRFIPFTSGTEASFPLRLAWHGQHASPATRRVVEIVRQMFQDSDGSDGPGPSSD